MFVKEHPYLSQASKGAFYFMEIQIKKAVVDVVDALLSNNAKKAAKYISDKMVIRGSRKTYQGKITKHGNQEILLVIGKPNYEQRDFIKRCKASGEPFPVKKIQLKFPKK